MEENMNAMPGPGPEYGPIDRLEELYVGRVEAEKDAWVAGTIDAATGGEEVKVRTRGEILLHGVLEGATFVLNEVRRFALFGRVDDPQSDDPFGEFSLVGPVGEVTPGQVGAGTIEAVPLQFHYRELSLIGLKTQESYEGGEARDIVYFPPVVQMTARIHWQQVAALADRGVRLQLEVEVLDAPEFNAKLELKNQAGRIWFQAPIVVDFAWAGAAQASLAGGAGAPPAAFMLAAVLVAPPCGQPSQPCAAGAELLLLRELPVRFVDLSTVELAEDVFTLCNRQLTGICEVWRQQAILNLVISPVFETGDSVQIADFHFFDDSNWSDLVQHAGLISGDQVDVYIVDEVRRSNITLPGGGATYDASKTSVGVFLAKGVMAGDPYLLAHELGHALGLGHPGENTVLNDGTVLPEGSWDSVMDPESATPAVNTLQNCQIFGSALLNPLVRVAVPERTDCLRVTA